MPLSLTSTSALSSVTLPIVHALELQSFTHADRRIIFPALLDALLASGCWVLERRSASLTRLDIHFEIHLNCIIELYMALIAVGLELTRDSHLGLTSQCVLRRHHPASEEIGCVLDVRLEVNFLEDLGLQPVTVPPPAAA